MTYVFYRKLSDPPGTAWIQRADKVRLALLGIGILGRIERQFRGISLHSSTCCSCYRRGVSACGRLLALL